jgi:triosephosphate isomerase
MRKPLLAGNWKMYKIISESVDLAAGLKRTLADVKGADIVVCPVFSSLSSVYSVLEDTDIALGAQDVYWEKEGAFTGEVSPLMIKDCGCEYVIIGHSERRKYFFETDETINKKIKAAQEVGLIPIVCIGETLQEREAHKTIEVVKKQLEGCFAGIDEDSMMHLVIAYEPVWAIGTGKTATPEQAQEVHQYIRHWIQEHYTSRLTQYIRILYGGSVKPANINKLMQQDDIDGALVGGASLDVTSFTDIVKNSFVI